MDCRISERQREEERYHDTLHRDDADAKIARVEGEYYRYFWDCLGDVAGKKVLDFGCGNGWVSIFFARQGALVWGFDISGELIKKAGEWARRENLSSRITLDKMAAEYIDYPNDFFDLIVGSAILHHTEIEVTLKNIQRIMKPGGRAVFVEPMNQNIFLKIWRQLTPWRRSKTEKALTGDDIDLIMHVFPEAKVTAFGLLSIFSSGVLLLFKTNKAFIAGHRGLEKLDRSLFRMLPFLRKYCAVVVLEITKSVTPASLLT